MKIKLFTNNPNSPTSTLMLNQLVGKLESRVESIETVEQPSAKGQMAVETICLIIATATPVFALIYQATYDWFQERSSKRRELETEIPRNFKLTVSVSTKLVTLQSENDAKNLDIEISSMGQNGLSSIEIIIEHGA